MGTDWAVNQVLPWGKSLLNTREHCVDAEHGLTMDEIFQLTKKLRVLLQAAASYRLVHCS